MTCELNACRSTNDGIRSTINNTIFEDTSHSMHNEFKRFCVRMVLDNSLENIRTLRALPQKNTFMPAKLTQNMFHWSSNGVHTGVRRSTASDLTLVLRTHTVTDVFQHKKVVDLQNIENLIKNILFDAKEALSKIRECERVLFLLDKVKKLNEFYKQRHSDLKETLKAYELDKINRKESIIPHDQLTEQFLVINPIRDRHILQNQFTYEDIMIYKMLKNIDDLKLEIKNFQQKHREDLRKAYALESYYIEELKFFKVTIEEKNDEYAQLLDHVELEINNKKTELKDLHNIFKYYKQLREEYREKIRIFSLKEWKRKLSQISQQVTG